MTTCKECTSTNLNKMTISSIQSKSIDLIQTKVFVFHKLILDDYKCGSLNFILLSKNCLYLISK